VEKQKPITEYTKLLKKFGHLGKDDLAELQAIVDKRFHYIKALTKMERLES
jgi:hypothetical protein